MNAGAKIYVTRLARKSRAPVLFLDDVGLPKPDGVYVTLDLIAAEALALTVVFTDERFHRALGKVMRETMPASNGIKLH